MSLNSTAHTRSDHCKRSQQHQATFSGRQVREWQVTAAKGDGWHTSTKAARQKPNEVRVGTGSDRKGGQVRAQRLVLGEFSLPEKPEIISAVLCIYIHTLITNHLSHSRLNYTHGFQQGFYTGVNSLFLHSGYSVTSSVCRTSEFSHQPM